MRKQLMRLRTVNRRRLRRIALSIGTLAICCLIFASNRYLYFSHQRFPILAGIQWNHQPSSEVRGNRPVIVGHRGLGLESTNPYATVENKLIGNTKSSIEGAIGTNVDWIEIDIRVTKNGKLVVFHDPTINAKTTYSGNKGEVEGMTLQALKSYDVLTKVNPPEKILSLEEVFNQFQADKRHWVLDVKADGISDDVVAQIRESTIPKEQIIIFGEHTVLEAYKGKGYRLGYTTLFSKHHSMLYSSSDVIRRCKDNSYDLLVVPVVFVTPNLVSSARKNGIDVWSYDSNEPRDLEYCAECGVKGLIVDNPEDAISQFSDWGDRR